MGFSFFMKRGGTESPKPISKKENKIVETKKTVTEVASDQKPVYAFIDASNIFWGGRASLGFNVDYKKFLAYLNTTFAVTKTFYYGGIRTFDFEYSVLDNKPLDLAKLLLHLNDLQAKAKDEEKAPIERSLNKLNFYMLLESYGYTMKIKPAKVYYGEEDEERALPLLKANCDVDLTFDLMRYMEQYSGAVVMTGDGDFAPVLSYLKYHDRKITVISRYDRTASEIRTIAGDDLVDLGKLRSRIILY